MTFVSLEESTEPSTNHIEPPEDLEVQYVKGVGPKRAGLLNKIGIFTLSDLLYHLPRRYEDRTNFKRISAVRIGEPVTLKGRILNADLSSARSGMSVVRAHLDDGTGIVELVWFGQKWMKDRVLHKKHEFIVYGVPQESGWGVSINGPEWEEVSSDRDSLDMNRIVPIYPLTEGVSQKMMRGIVFGALETYLDRFQESLPESLRREYKLGGIRKSLRQVHFPEKFEFVDIARRRLVFEEFLLLQLGAAIRRSDISLLPGMPFDIADDLLDRIQSNLPWPLTGAQVRVINEIWNDMRQPKPMNRLLQGDVGSGKTVVAASAIVAAVNGGCQAALMAPTEILAEQHHAVLTEALARYGIKPDLLVGRLGAKQKRTAKERVADGRSSVVVGTHALIQEGVEFGRLGLVVIDEQHRFGVMQRASLQQKGINPDVLVMSATPIPRTLTMTVHGELDVSILDEMPAGRLPVKTRWKQLEDRPSVYEGVRQIVNEGRQAYIVCPLVSESEKVQMRAATALAEHLQTDVFPELVVGLLHGQMKSVERDEVMVKFRAGEMHILVATTVIEVGVDVPNAGAMVIEDAHRFGLAQLHQLRGRVGRGAEQAYCVLVADPRTEEAIRRINVLVATTNGFEIAEEDLRIRGPGEAYGTKQTGMTSFKVADLVRDERLLDEARNKAFEMIKEDRSLSSPEFAQLKQLVEKGRSKMLVASVS